MPTAETKAPETKPVDTSASAPLATPPAETKAIEETKPAASDTSDLPKAAAEFSLADLVAAEARRLKLMTTVEYTDHVGVLRPAVVTKILGNGLVNLVAYGVHAGDPPTDLVCGIMCNPLGGAPNRWRHFGR